MTLLIPALGVISLIIMGFFSGQALQALENTFETEDQIVGIVDENGIATPLLPSWEDVVVFADESALRAALEAGEIGLAAIIEPDYMETGVVRVITGEGRTSISELESTDVLVFLLRDHVIQSAVDDPLVQERVRDPINIDYETQTGDAENFGASFAADFVVSYVLAIVLIVSIFSSSGYLMRGVAAEKANRIVEIILSSVPAWQLLAGKVLGLGALGLTQIGVWLLSTVALSGGMVALVGVAIPLLAETYILVLAAFYYIFGYLIYAVLMAAGSAIGTTEQESQQIAGLFSLGASIPLMLSGFIFTNPNIGLARILSWFPLTAPTMMLVRLPLGDVPVIDIIGSVAVLVITIPLLVWLGSKVFRMGLLMYSSRPTPKEIWRMLRAG